ncbi:hypothetical protein PIB30_000143 [Stylosanthes scabra]|uniref:Uncharacterized protein n=1 Tax=Stylosanthes scabra TaxID=79078 RepID=A0ABU6R327_9FABA|nr:hypothetical protein [Stylosanthes scabra]
MGDGEGAMEWGDEEEGDGYVRGRGDKGSGPEEGKEADSGGGECCPARLFCGLNEPTRRSLAHLTPLGSSDQGRATANVRLSEGGGGLQKTGYEERDWKAFFFSEKVG